MKAKNQYLLTEYDKLYQRAEQEQNPCVKEVIAQNNKRCIIGCLAMIIVMDIIWDIFILYIVATGKFGFDEIHVGKIITMMMIYPITMMPFMYCLYVIYPYNIKKSKEKGKTR